MPGSAARIDPFFLILPRLTVEQKAAAVHLGVFPTASEIKLAANEPARNIAPPPPAVRPAARPRAQIAPSRSERLAVGRRTIVPSSPITTVVGSGAGQPTVAAPVAGRRAIVPASPITTVFGSGVVQPIVAAPVARSIDPAPPTPAPVAVGTQPSPAPVAVVSVPTATPVTPSTAPKPAPVEPAPPPPAEPRDTAAASLATTPPASTFADLPTPGFSAQTGLASIDRLSGLEKLLAEADEATAPAPSRPTVERAAAVTPAATGAKKAVEIRKLDKKKAEAKRLADEKKAEAKRLAEEKKEREAIGVAGTNWVQLAGGANADRMGVEFRKLAAKSSALRKRGGNVTEGKDYFRLLAGPFDSKSDAQAFVNQLAKDGVDGFSWTRTPPTIKIEKIPPK